MTDRASRKEDMFMKDCNRGFTLIELLIVISIMIILSTMALPSYQDRVIRAQVGQAIAMAEVAKKDIQDFYRAKGSLPKNNGQAGLPEAGKFIGNYVTSLQVNDGAIDITLGNRVNKNAENKVLTIRPAVVAGAHAVPISWVCGHASVPKGMSVTARNGTTLPPRMLPVDCRY